MSKSKTRTNYNQVSEIDEFRDGVVYDQEEVVEEEVKVVEKKVSERKRKVIAHRLNVRTEPNRTSDGIELVLRGDILKTIGSEKNGWVKVETPSTKIGYVLTTFLGKVDE